MNVDPAALSRVSTNWRYALFGGAVSVAITLSTAWGTAAADDIPALAAFLGAFVAVLAAAGLRTDPNPTEVGVWTGVLGSLPALSLIAATLLGSWTPSGPVAAGWDVLGVIVMCGAIVGFASLSGLLGATLGDVLAGTDGDSATPSVSDR